MSAERPNFISNKYFWHNAATIPAEQPDFIQPSQPEQTQSRQARAESKQSLPGSPTNNSFEETLAYYRKAHQEEMRDFRKNMLINAGIGAVVASPALLLLLL